MKLKYILIFSMIAFVVTLLSMFLTENIRLIRFFGLLSTFELALILSWLIDFIPIEHRQIDLDREVK